MLVGCMNILKTCPTLQFRTSEVLDHILPIWWVIISSQIRLKFSTQNLKSSTLSDTVGSHQSQNLSRSWCRQSVKLEAVCRVTMCDLGFQVGWQIDNVDGAKGALLGTDTTSNTQVFGDEGDFRGGLNFDTKATTANHGTRLLAFLSTFLRET